jgi:DNA-binding CsgD family transcriptional regulator
VTGLLRERDLRALTAVVEDGLRDDPGDDAMPWAVLQRLLEVVPADKVQVDDRDLAGERTVFSQLLFDGGDRFLARDYVEADENFWRLRNEFLPCSYSARTGDLQSVVRWSDFHSQASLREAPFYAEYFPGSGIRYALTVPLPSPPGRTRYVWLARDRRDFGERDRLVLAVLRPHLSEVFLDAERRRRGVPRLSPREMEVLRLAAQGHSNAEIARALFISVATVRKHMEHVFDRTGVRNRAAAAALVLPRARTLAGPPPGDLRL